jgi:hypothetical protein
METLEGLALITAEIYKAAVEKFWWSNLCPSRRG